MSMGSRPTEHQESLWTETSSLPRTSGHPFYEKLNSLLRQHGFDSMAEKACAEFYAEGLGRPSTPPGVYFRMLFIGFFEGIDSERGIAWRAADSMALRSFLGYGLSEKTPDHSNLSRTRNRIDLSTHQKLFDWVLAVLACCGCSGDRTADELSVAQSQVMEVEVVRASRSPIKSTLELVGTLIPIRVTTVVSDVDGIIKSLYIATEGGVVTPGMTIMDIVPAGDKLVIEAHLPISDIGFVSSGQIAVIQLASADSRRFGKLEGTVAQVSPDAFTTDEGSMYYTVRIDTDQDHFEKNNHVYRLYPGILVQVFIHIGQRSVLEYLLDPFLTTLSNSLQER